MRSKRSLVSVSTSLRSGVSLLHRDWNAVQIAHKNLASKQIKFAQRVKQLWIKAKSLDAGTLWESHQNYIRDELTKIIKTDNRSILSRWVKIGGQADKLLPISEALPQQRDALYETAKVAEKNVEVLLNWVDKGQIHSASTVREVKELTNKKESNRKEKQKGIEILTVIYPLKNGYRNFALIKDELEEFFRARKIPYIYRGALAEYEDSLSKYYTKIEKEALKLAKRFLKHEIKKAIERRYANLGMDGGKKVPFVTKLQALCLNKNEVDPSTCADTDELGELYIRMELDEDRNWSSVIADIYADAMTNIKEPKSPLPSSHLLSDENESTRNLGVKRKKPDFSSLKV
jgi:hypothetical protein